MSDTSKTQGGFLLEMDDLLLWRSSDFLIRWSDVHLFNGSHPSLTSVRSVFSEDALVRPFLEASLSGDVFSELICVNFWCISPPSKIILEAKLGREIVYLDSRQIQTCRCFSKPQLSDARLLEQPGVVSCSETLLRQILCLFLNKIYRTNLWVPNASGSFEKPHCTYKTGTLIFF